MGACAARPGRRSGFPLRGRRRYALRGVLASPRLCLQSTSSSHHGPCRPRISPADVRGSLPLPAPRRQWTSPAPVPARPSSSPRGPGSHPHSPHLRPVLEPGAGRQGSSGGRRCQEIPGCRALPPTSPPSFPSPASLPSFTPPPPGLMLSLPFPSPHSFLLLPDPPLCAIASVCLPLSPHVPAQPLSLIPLCAPHPPCSSSACAGRGLASAAPDLCTMLALSWGFRAKRRAGHKRSLSPARPPCTRPTLLCWVSASSPSKAASPAPISAHTPGRRAGRLDQIPTSSLLF